MTQEDTGNTHNPNEENIKTEEFHDTQAAQTDEGKIVEDQQAPIGQDVSELEKLKEALARQQADYDNFKKRVERDRGEMMFFLRADILNKVLPRLDDIERILASTPGEQKESPFFIALESTYSQLVKDLEKMGCVSFVSKGNIADPEKHEVMTQAPGEDGIIIDEFLKGYMLGEKVLRHAKVVVGNGNI